MNIKHAFNRHELAHLHCEPKKHTKMFCHIFYKNHVDSDKIWYTLS